MSELVKLLRDTQWGAAPIVSDVCKEAADEIERTEECFQGVMKDNADLALEIERLERELAEEQIKRAETVVIVGRLRAALEQISRDEFSHHWRASDSEVGDDYWRVVNIARKALGPEARENE